METDIEGFKKWLHNLNIGRLPFYTIVKPSEDINVGDIRKSFTGEERVVVEIEFKRQLEDGRIGISGIELESDK